MKTKKCSRCHSVHPLTREYWYVKSESKDGFSTWCKDCKKEVDKKRNSRKKVRLANNSNSAQRKLVAKTYIYEQLSKSKCVDCGETNILALEYDHINGDKLKGVGRLANSGYSLSVIKEEISKCVVRCSNCHRAKTHKENNTHLYQYFQQLLKT